MSILILLAFLQSATPQTQMPELAGKPVAAFTLRYIDVASGLGAAAQPAQKYTVHYTGWLTDGKQFDSSRDRNEPFEFVQGRRQVIAGWEAGFEGMRVGGKRRLFIPYQMAYGEKGRGAIPPKAELIFDVELLAVADVPMWQASAEVLDPLKAMEQKILALAKAVPEEKYAWRPSPAVRSFGEVMIHIANGNRLLLNIATKAPGRAELEQEIAANAALEKKAFSRAEIIKLVTDSFAALKQALEPLSAGALGREMQFFGTPTTQRGIFVLTGTHVAEHLGQAIAYARTIGIAPPWSL